METQFPLKNVSLLSICRMIAYSFLFALKIYSLETQDPDEDARQDMTKIQHAKNFFFFFSPSYVGSLIKVLPLPTNLMTLCYYFC